MVCWHYLCIFKNHANMVYDRICTILVLGMNNNHAKYINTV